MNAAEARVGDRVILRAPLEASHWLFGSQTFHVSAAATIEEVTGRSVRVRIDSVSGVPRKYREEATELIEGWHSLDDIRVRAGGDTNND